MKLEWEPDWLPPPSQQEKIEEQVRAEILELNLDSPSKLIFHHTFLGDDQDKRMYVFSYGQEGSDVIKCRYDVNTKWEVVTP